MTLPRFYPIFDSAQWLVRALPLGVRLVQLRVKERSEAGTRAEIAAARRLCATHGAELVVNDHWRLAIEEGCGFVHLGQEDLDEADLPAIRRAGLRLGVSTHDEAELDRALATAPDYVALGPIWPTRLKAMRFGPQGLERIGAWKRRIGGIPLVAIGGLTAERAAQTLAAGADVLSVVTDITLAPDPEARIRDWIAASAPPSSGASR
ncbi:MAG: thiamine phosphate synthase [Pseudomonadota bacterium]